MHIAKAIATENPHVSLHTHTFNSTIIISISTNTKNERK
jgi:hypothetical protein